ncbi:UDP-N-acetylmuramoyl-L-alanyl-D-glutamate--2,6-diaminopimelate ligase [Faecalimonas sp.]
MELKNLLQPIKYSIRQGKEILDIEKITQNSKKVGPNTLFVCIKGARTDGSFYIGEAVEKGAVAILSDREVEVPKGITLILVENARKTLAKIAAVFYGEPSKEMFMIGITGTKGKTTTAYMIYHILKEAGYRVGLIGTIEVRIGEKSIPTQNTSPESIDVQFFLKEMLLEKCNVAIMEVSSQGLKLHRTDEIQFDIGVFTNLGKDHISKFEHKNFEEYKNCKAKLFTQSKRAIVNIDNPYWEEMLKDSKCAMTTFGFSKKADYYAKNVKAIKKNGKLGIQYQIAGRMCGKISLVMAGKFNVYNALCAIAVCKELDVSFEEIKKSLEKVQVKGRVEQLCTDRGTVVLIDYAHNAMSLQSILEMVHSYRPRQIICIFGCGGNRTKEGRRYEMGKVSGILSDFTIITSDNPRYEDPLQIMSEIREGIESVHGRCLEICNRKEAIRYGIKCARKNDIIVLAGKGHEEYQEIEGMKYHMTDREMVCEIIDEDKKNVCRRYY